MRLISHCYAFGIIGCLVLSACTAKKQDPYDLYALPPLAGGASGNLAPVDNDMYYTPPKTPRCTTINELPSCSGGM